MTIKMNKQEIRALLGQLITLQTMLENMQKEGFSWDAVQTVSDNLRLIIIDLEKALD
jgi:hypothetical protein